MPICIQSVSIKDFLLWLRPSAWMSIRRGWTTPWF
jgi:hypothetical protein